jgi:hypothetical protein
MEARAGIEPAIEVLQTSALPLGYRAAKKERKIGDPLERSTGNLSFPGRGPDFRIYLRVNAGEYRLLCRRRYLQ